MSLTKKIKKLASNFIPSPIKIDFQKGGGSAIQEVAPYPKEAFWDSSVPIQKTNAGLEYVRTPAERFENLSGYSFTENYVDINGLQMHYVEEGSIDGEVVLMLHGQPTWSYLYRKMIKGLVEKGYRCIAPDLIGMGKSDKPIHEKYHTYDQHCEDILKFIQKIGLQNVTVFVQDWGSLIGMRIVGENPNYFARVILANGDLPSFKADSNKFYIPNPVIVNPKVNALKPAVAKYALKGMEYWFQSWILYCLTNMNTFVGEVMNLSTEVNLTEAETAGYEAPFPSFIFMAGPRTLPSMNAGLRGQQMAAIEGLKKFKKPFLSLIGLKDGLLGRRSIQKKWVARIPGAKGQNHEQFENANHFIQEDIGEIMADRTHQFIQKNPI
ncbi:MAG: haloalkane dehalogenase [Saprospiraceae bacterium]